LTKTYPLPTQMKRLRWTSGESLVEVPTHRDADGSDRPKVGSFEGWTYPGGPALHQNSAPNYLTCFRLVMKAFVMGSRLTHCSCSAGGITKPKKITCRATDGRFFLQIVKGGDDPRLDSITAQLFCVINLLLRGNRECRRRELEVRTYNVIPLHPQVRQSERPFCRSCGLSRIFFVAKRIFR
jgi:hypothetical protein